MHITQAHDQLARGKIGHCSDHHRKDRIACDVERQAEKDVRAALIKMTAELSSMYVKLKERMARRKRDCIALFRVPSSDDEPATRRILSDLIDEILDLVDPIARVRAI